MAKKTRQSKKARHLVLGHLERVSSKVFSDFPRQLTDLVGRQHGVYALYKGDRLYYVGLATNLRRRIKHHLSDRHAGKWDRFSLYLVRSADRIKELESLILRIADPTGNVTGGHLPGAATLDGRLGAAIKTEQEKTRKGILGTKRPSAGRRKPQPRKPSAAARKAGQVPLAPYVKKRWFKVRGTRTGKSHEARVLSDGRIEFNGTIYTSPSGAGKAATGKTTDGWRFWRFKNDAGEWVKLDELRKAAGG